MSSEIKQGDKVYCIKNIHRESDDMLIFQKNYIYTVCNIKSATKNNYNYSTSDETIILINYDDSFHYAFWLNTNRTENLFYDSFCDFQGYRKRKLIKLYDIENNRK